MSRDRLPDLERYLTDEYVREEIRCIDTDLLRWALVEIRYLRLLAKAMREDAA